MQIILGTFNFITIPGNCTYVHKTLFLERTNGIRTTSYDVNAFYYYNSIGGNYDDTFVNTVTLELET